ncbi:hypothetical protein HK103_003799 [Boothiomyces macroporosus]|uniref:RNA methyltransferase n=1 Tax=Boothiomyces macroporosus TaxID=261099 RepID=A0AAD5YB21_9FUNG|nr:hypothetical protein HK103_003799 [Boothiomyces macroporosus]
MSLNPYLAHLNDPTTSNYRRVPTFEIKRKKNSSVELQKNPKETIYGNYKNYYGYRATDSRIMQFDKDWFEGKRVCDIGCNAGRITVEIAKKFNTSYVEGVDIDPELIRKARYSLAVTQSLAGSDRQQYFPISCVEQFGMLPIHLQKDFNIHFRCGDWLHESFPSPTDTLYDVVLALSITKWIHLNNGDGGVRYFFKKCYNYLNKGGIFILECQGLDGYRKRAGMTAEMRQNYSDMEFFPDEFPRYLEKKIGFKLLKKVIPDEEGGFNRPLYIYIK